MKKHDYSKLRGKIKEILGNEKELASILKLSNASVSAKLNSKVPFTIPEIDRIVEVLSIPVEEIHCYFFDIKVEIISTINKI